MNTLRIQGVILLGITIGMYFLAHKYSLYYIFWWYDWVQHFIGGLALGLLGKSWWIHAPWKIIGITFGCAIAWEIFERIGSWIAPQFLGYGGLIDTSMDILIAVFGTFLVLFLTRHDVKN